MISWSLSLLLFTLKHSFSFCHVIMCLKSSITILKPTIIICYNSVLFNLLYVDVFLFDYFALYVVLYSNFLLTNLILWYIVMFIIIKSDNVLNNYLFRFYYLCCCRFRCGFYRKNMYFYFPVIDICTSSTLFSMFNLWIFF